MLGHVRHFTSVISALPVAMPATVFTSGCDTPRMHPPPTAGESYCGRSTLMEGFLVKQKVEGAGRVMRTAHVLGPGNCCDKTEEMPGCLPPQHHGPSSSVTSLRRCALTEKPLFQYKSNSFFPILTRRYVY